MSYGGAEAGATTLFYTPRFLRRARGPPSHRMGSEEEEEEEEKEEEEEEEKDIKREGAMGVIERN